MQMIRSLILLVALLTAASVIAEEPRKVTLVERLAFTGEVERVFMVALSDLADPEIVEASWIAPAEQGGLFSCVARVGLPAVTERLRVLSVILGTNGEVRSACRESLADELPPAAQLTLAELRERFIERRGVYRNLQNQAQAQEQRLLTLQRDADNIAMVSRIVSAEDQLSEIKTKLERVAAAESAIDRRREQIKTRPQPLNAQKRESELVAQLGKLAAAY